MLFAIPVLWVWRFWIATIAVGDDERASVGGSHRPSDAFRCARIGGVGIVLLPYWLALLKNPISQMPIPHGSRDNYILHPMSGVNFWLIPMGAMILALPFIVIRGAAERRLRPLLFGWYLTPARAGWHHSRRQASTGPRLRGAHL